MQYFPAKYLNLIFQHHLLSILLPLLVFDIQSEWISMHVIDSCHSCQTYYHSLLILID